MHRLDEIRREWEVVILDDDLVAPVRQDVGDLPCHDCDRAATAQEEIEFVIQDLSLPA